MNSFDGFVLTGANKTRYVPIIGNATGIIGAYRKAVGVKVRAHAKRYGKIELGLMPLFLLDGELTAKTLKKAVETLRLTDYVAIYRPYNIKIRKRLENEYQLCRTGGIVNKDGSVSEWALEDKRKKDMNPGEWTGKAAQPYFDYETARDEYTEAIGILPVDAATGSEIIGDINDFLYERAREIYPLGVESLLESNIKQSAILKHQFFIDGAENAPAPKGVRKYGKDNWQMTLFDSDRPYIDDTIEELRGFLQKSIELTGVVKIFDLMVHCAEIGLYKGNITLYAIGAALQYFNKKNAVYHDGIAYFRYTEVIDISSCILTTYEYYKRNKTAGIREAAMFFDDTGLKERLEYIFGAEPAREKSFDTLGMAVVRIGSWITENLCYPIAFVDDTLRRLLWDNTLYGEKLKYYDAYFNDEKCEYLKPRIQQADIIARDIIRESVGFDPDITEHGLSRLPKRHFSRIYYSADDYIEAIQRKAV